MKPIIEIINQLTSLEGRVSKSEETERIFNRIRQALLELGFSYVSPLNEEYKDTRTDLDATIVGESTNNLMVTKVIKPVIVSDAKIVQRGIVIVEGR